MVGRKMVVPRDFAWLSEKVEERTQQRVSASTLRRFWGYVSEGVSASKFTKNVLANFLGYADFEEFGLSQGTGEQQSQMVIGKEISCDDLYEGQMLKLSWLPDRTCIIRKRALASSLNIPKPRRIHPSASKPRSLPHFPMARNPCSQQLPSHLLHHRHKPPNSYQKARRQSTRCGRNPA